MKLGCELLTTMMCLGIAQFPEKQHKHLVLGIVAFGNAIPKTHAQMSREVT